ncbi:hypothetical protein ACH46_12405 [Gordonia phthalatica]|uniref:Uncharacterized protein n=1 Tax=Gordonia phthalatica TaxID=1136941 RepID=A0A0N9NI00_9ACTN|nr:hypothetical protein ACH46_12405 [Gordonia phthalatica]
MSTAAAALVVAAGLTACSSEEPVDDGPCAATAASKTNGARSINLPDTQVSVVSPGQGEAKPLTVSPDAGTRQEVTLETSSTEASIAPTAKGSDKNEVQKTQQQLVTPLTARIVCDDPTSLELGIGAPTSKDTDLAPLLTDLDGSTAGLSFAAGMSPTRLRLKPNDSAQSPARSSLEQSLIGALDYAVPLPTTPVAPGATWRAVRTVSAAATVTQTMTVTLVSRKGDVLDLDVTVSEEPVNSVFAIPGSDAKLHISRYSMSGTGSFVVDLRRLLPTTGTLTMKGGRELVGDDPNRPILQQNEFTLAWKKSK